MRSAGPPEGGPRVAAPTRARGARSRGTRDARRARTGPEARAAPSAHRHLPVYTAGPPPFVPARGRELQSPERRGAETGAEAGTRGPRPPPPPPGHPRDPARMRSAAAPSRGHPAHARPPAHLHPAPHGPAPPPRPPPNPRRGAPPRRRPGARRGAGRREVTKRRRRPRSAARRRPAPQAQRRYGAPGGIRRRSSPRASPPPRRRSAVPPAPIPQPPLSAVLTLRAPVPPAAEQGRGRAGISARRGAAGSARCAAVQCGAVRSSRVPPAAASAAQNKGAGRARDPRHVTAALGAVVRVGPRSGRSPARRRAVPRSAA